MSRSGPYRIYVPDHAYIVIVYIARRASQLVTCIASFRITIASYDIAVRGWLVLLGMYAEMKLAHWLIGGDIYRIVHHVCSNNKQGASKQHVTLW